MRMNLELIQWYQPSAGDRMGGRASVVWYIVLSNFGGLGVCCLRFQTLTRANHNRKSAFLHLFLTTLMTSDTLFQTKVPDATLWPCSNHGIVLKK